MHLPVRVHVCVSTRISELACRLQAALAATLLSTGASLGMVSAALADGTDVGAMSAALSNVPTAVRQHRNRVSWRHPVAEHSIMASRYL